MPNLKPYGGPTKLVVAFDIGTTFSGISYCILEKGQVPEVLGVTRFPEQPLVAGDARVPSLLYYDESGNVRAAGAEVNTESVIETALNKRWTKAEWWKLHLRPKHLASSINRDNDLPPLPSGKSADDVLTDFVKYLFKCVKSHIQEHHIALTWSSIEHSIDYIFTHPNGWEGIQQQKYHQAAERAGLIPASLHFCVPNPLNVEKPNQSTPQGVVIIDGGGGTIDLSLFSMTFNPISCEEIAPAECRLQGSVFVTRRAKALLQRKLDGWEHSSPDEIAEFTREFDKTMKLIIKSDQEPAYLRVGGHRTKSVEYNISSGKLKLSGEEVTSLFNESIDAITDAFEQQQKSATTPITTAFFVGGLSTNDWLWSRLQAYFKDKNINICRRDNHINKAVANGAVLSHVDRHLVASRVARTTYGVVCALPVKKNNKEHIRRKNWWERDPTGECFVPGYFELKLAKGDHIPQGLEFRETFSLTESDPANFGMQTVRLECYRGSLSKPEWTTVANFSKYCAIRIDLSVATKDLVWTRDPSGQVFYQLDYDVIVLFGLAELQAYLGWMSKDGERRRVSVNLTCCVV
ncbi:hypothetical protein HD554DRAFT_2254112 [Boletus coccyginus]|nr:hypothetical protein HD554DRAFT_2254112 [Boletus coccyginus]